MLGVPACTWYCSLWNQILPVLLTQLPANTHTREEAGDGSNANWVGCLPPDLDGVQSSWFAPNPTLAVYEHLGRESAAASFSLVILIANKTNKPKKQVTVEWLS